VLFLAAANDLAGGEVQRRKERSGVLDLGFGTGFD